MKKDIHPDYHTIKIIMTDGTEFETRSTWGKEGDTLRLDVDPKSHPVWLGGTGILKQTGQMDKYSQRYGNMKLSRKKNPDAVAKTETANDKPEASPKVAM